METSCRLLSTSSGRGAFLAAVGYSAHALHFLLASSPLTTIRTRLRLLLLQNGYRSQTATLQKAVVASAPTSKPSLLALSSLISETRYTLRLLDLISLWRWGSVVAKSPPQDPVLHFIALVQVTSCVLYQATENVAYLASKGIAGNSLVARTGGIKKWFLFSVRAWLCHILFEFVRLYREITLIKQKAMVASSEEGSDVTEAERKARVKAQNQSVRAWKKSLVNNLAWAPLCIHWSLQKGIGVPESLTGFISLMAGAWGLYDSWNATAA